MRGCTLQLSMRSSRLVLLHHIFAVRVVQPWNSLPEEVLSSLLKVFKAKLDNFWKDQPVKFDYKEELCLYCNYLAIEELIMCPANSDDDDNDDYEIIQFWKQSRKAVLSGLEKIT